MTISSWNHWLVFGVLLVWSKIETTVKKMYKNKMLVATSISVWVLQLYVLRNVEKYQRNISPWHQEEA